MVQKSLRNVIIVFVEMRDELFIVVINSFECLSKHDLGVRLHVLLKPRLKCVLKHFLNWFLVNYLRVVQDETLKVGVGVVCFCSRCVAVTLHSCKSNWENVTVCQIASFLEWICIENSNILKVTAEATYLHFSNCKSSKMTVSLLRCG